METSSRVRRSVLFVLGPDGAPLSIADLPPSNTVRWVTNRKAQVVAAVVGGLLSMKEACSRYNLSRDEFLNWHQSVARFGKSGLRATKLQQYRSDSQS